jgi:arabinan endo-1,5-alpha-L-arabinosidase
MLKPVWDGYLADPMVFKAGDLYYAIGTGERALVAETGRVFPILVSSDLRDWEFVGGALVPPAESAGTAYWAPEVACKDGVLYLYYSNGGEEGQGHQIRVAASDKPEGPYSDLDKVLLPDEPFSIDASPFLDPVTGKWFLYFCRDYFDPPVGTGVAGAELAEDMKGLASPPKDLLRAQGDWQIFERDRMWYGRVWSKWHTVEGPFVVCRQGRYWMFYSGGCWKEPGYGVGYAVADDPLGPYVAPHDEQGPSVLQSGMSGLIGPGHNSVVVGPDGRDHIVFHAWDHVGGKRQMYIQPIDWSQGRPALGL